MTTENPKNLIATLLKGLAYIGIALTSYCLGVASTPDAVEPKTEVSYKLVKNDGKHDWYKLVRSDGSVYFRRMGDGSFGNGSVWFNASGDCVDYAFSWPSQGDLEAEVRAFEFKKMSK